MTTLIRGNRRAMQRRTLTINAVLGAGVLVVAGTALVILRSPQKAAASEQTTRVDRGSITATVSASGNAQSLTNLGVSFTDCTGTLTSVQVKPGQKVTDGQVLATVDPATAQQAVDSAQRSLDSANTSWSDAISQAQTQLSNAQSTRALDLEQAQRNVDDARTAYRAETDPTKKDQLQSTLQQAKDSYASTQLRDDQTVASASASVDQARSSSGQQGQQVSTAKQNLADAQQTRSHCTLYSPVAATVVAVNGVVGSAPGSSAVGSSSSSSTSSSSTGSSGTGSSTGATSSGSGSTSTSGVSTSIGFITLADLGAIVIPATVSESDIGSVKVGQTASVTFAALRGSGDTANANGTTIAGKVTHVDLSSTVSNSVVSYGVQVRLDSVPAGLRLGQSASVTITTASAQNVLRLTSSAITKRGGRSTVQVKDGSAVTTVSVTTGLTGNGTTEIKSGLSEGQTVVIPATTSNGSTGSLIGGGGPPTGLLGGGGPGR
jgi:multidrug efflux pump subunit AcrA (membrane-fusion protein)